MKKLIIHMNNGDEYHIKENENFDRRYNLTISELSRDVAEAIKEKYSHVVICEDAGYRIRYVSLSVMYSLEKLWISANNISSLEVREVK